MSLNEINERVSRLRQYMRDNVCELAGVEDAAGPEIIALIHLLDHMCGQVPPNGEGMEVVSGPRLGLLMRLYSEEMRGNRGGLTPTQFSHFQSVSKNTISSLLRGVEEHGFVQRTLDPQDLRLFRIQLTPSGRDLVRQRIPELVAATNRLVSGLTKEERETLLGLLEKLYGSIMIRTEKLAGGCPAEIEQTGGEIAQSERI